jgi:hypothetical protein
MLTIPTQHNLPIIKAQNTDMASPQPLPAVESTKEGPVLEHYDDIGDDSKKDIEQPDRFGSYAKVNPKEIALVKKLDLYMMVAHHGLSWMIEVDQHG